MKNSSDLTFPKNYPFSRWDFSKEKAKLEGSLIESSED